MGLLQWVMGSSQSETMDLSPLSNLLGLQWGGVMCLLQWLMCSSQSEAVDWWVMCSSQCAMGSSQSEAVDWSQLLGLLPVWWPGIENVHLVMGLSQ
jgi:hypothetical protein